MQEKGLCIDAAQCYCIKTSMSTKVSLDLHCLVIDRIRRNSIDGVKTSCRELRTGRDVETTKDLYVPAAWRRKKGGIEKLRLTRQSLDAKLLRQPLIHFAI